MNIDKTFFVTSMKQALKGLLQNMVFHKVIDITEEQAVEEIDKYLSEIVGEMSWGEYKEKLKEITDKLK